MKSILLALALSVGLLSGCAEAPTKTTTSNVLGATLVEGDFQVVPRQADAAAYLPVREHVFVQERDPSDYVVVYVRYGKRIEPPKAAPPVAVPVPPVSVKPLPEKVAVVTFAFDRSSLDRSAKAELDQFASTLLPGDEVIAIEGYTDAIGTHGYNKHLSTKRAEVVKRYLSSKGVNVANVQITAHAESDPVAGNDTEDGRAKNRRAQVRARD